MLTINDEGNVAEKSVPASHSVRRFGSETEEKGQDAGPVDQEGPPVSSSSLSRRQIPGGNNPEWSSGEWPPWMSCTAMLMGTSRRTDRSHALWHPKKDLGDPRDQRTVTVFAPAEVT